MRTAAETIGPYSFVAGMSECGNDAESSTSSILQEPNYSAFNTVSCASQASRDTGLLAIARAHEMY